MHNTISEWLETNGGSKPSPEAVKEFGQVQQYELDNDGKDPYYTFTTPDADVICNPYASPCGRFELTQDEAVDTYGAGEVREWENSIIALCVADGYTGQDFVDYGHEQGFMWDEGHDPLALVHFHDAQGRVIVNPYSYVAPDDDPADLFGREQMQAWKAQCVAVWREFERDCA